MCKQICENCKCKRGTPKEILVGINTVLDISEIVDYDGIKWKGLIPSTTSPRNLLNIKDNQKDNNNDTK